MYSDHVRVQLILNININYSIEVERPFNVRQAWYKAGEQEVKCYKHRLNELLSDIDLCDVMLHCTNCFVLSTMMIYVV